MNEWIVSPNGSLVQAGFTCEDYEKRVNLAMQTYECDYSDACGIVDAEILGVLK